ncbi:MAG TPA: ATP-binding protein [Chitinispirillaceae bacterium]|nr:ATP-binding protein [Chitinispirillaceae bacterium]
MKIAIASGKGGTGKTTISTNLALFLGDGSDKVVYLDCDVEEPNGHLFLNPVLSEKISSSIPVPVIDNSKCDVCGKCVRFCEYKALVRLGKTVMVFPELCHGCGGCTLICPHQAIQEQPREIGFVESGSSGRIGFVHGRLNIGEAMSPPLIRAVLQQIRSNEVNIIDAPPGTSCPVIASIRGADFVVLVTEPTPFGLNDLGLALDMVKELGIPHGVVVNRAEDGNRDAESFCDKGQVEILTRIQDDRRIAECYSKGEMILKGVPYVQKIFEELWNAIRKAS